MNLFMKKTPLQKEWDKLRKKEQRYIQKHREKREQLWKQKLKRKVPPKLQDTLDIAFEKAFALTFDKGTKVLEKTYPRAKLEQDFQVRQYSAEVKKDAKSLRAFAKKAKTTGHKNLLVSGASGIGMGILGIGLPDIVVFTAMVLKNVYEIALQYGYSYDTKKERYFILLVIQGAVTYGDSLQVIQQSIHAFIDLEKLPSGYQEQEQIHETAKALSEELLYMKFLQGIPVVGVIGGAYDAFCMKRISEYATLEYYRRFLWKQRRTNSKAKL